MRLRLIVLGVMIAVLALAGVSYAATSTPKATAPIKITVTLKDYSFGWSRASVPAGSTVVFTVKNVGAAQHNVDFTTLNKRSTIIAPGAKTTVKVVFKKKGSIQVVCDVPRHIQLGMVGTFKVK